LRLMRVGWGAADIRIQKASVAFLSRETTLTVESKSSKRSSPLCPMKSWKEIVKKRKAAEISSAA
jgi:hypothetical protein